jgi:hypothetical protein
VDRGPILPEVAHGEAGIGATPPRADDHPEFTRVFEGDAKFDAGGLRRDGAAAIESEVEAREERAQLGVVQRLASRDGGPVQDRDRLRIRRDCARARS